MRLRLWQATAVLTGVSLALTLATPAWAASDRERRAQPKPCSTGLVALTFDDGPSDAVTAELLGSLKRKRVPATFFVLGGKVVSNPGLVRRAHRQGHVIANHTYRHERLPRLSDAAIRATLRSTANVVRRQRTPLSRLMRPPYGEIDSRVRGVVADLGLTPVMWDIDTRDWRSGTAKQIAARALAGLRPHASNIVLQHDGVVRSPISVRAVPAIIRGARARGYCFATIGADGSPTPPVPHLSVTDAKATEGRSGAQRSLRFTLRLDRPTSVPVSVQVRTVARSATSGVDYRSVDKRIAFSVGRTKRRVSVRVLNDRIDERREKVRLQLSDPIGLAIDDPRGLGLIRDDDPTPRLSLHDAAVAEPATGTATAYVRATINRPRSRVIRFRLVTTPGTAEPADYATVDTTLTIPAGSTYADLPITVLPDQVDEPSETFTVDVRALSGARKARGTSTVTITPPVAASARPSAVD